MAYYYIKSGGTATVDAGRYATAQTGSFTTLGAANYYPSIEDIMTAYNAGVTEPVSGDTIVISDAHSETLSAARNIVAVTTAGNAAYLTFISVDDANCDTYAAATTAQIALAASLTVAQSRFYGIFFDVQTNAALLLTSVAEALTTFKDCYFDHTTGNDDFLMSLGASDSQLYINDCTHRTSGTATLAKLVTNSQENSVHIDNLTLVTGTGTWSTSGYIGGNAGTVTRISNSDLSPITNLLGNYGSLVGHNLIDVELNNCKINSSLTYGTATPATNTYRVAAFNCTDSTNDNPNQFHIEKSSGIISSVIEDGTSLVVRTDGTPMSMEAAGEYMAIKAVTNTNCGHYAPLVFNLHSKYSELSGTNQTIRIYLASSAALNASTDEILIKASYRDGTNPEQINTVLSTADFTPFSTGTTLTADEVSTWTNSGALSKYYIDLDTSGDVGMDCIPSVTVSIARSSATTIYFDSEYDLV